MIFVNGLCAVDAAEQGGSIKLRDSDQSLEEKKYVDDQADDVVGGSEMGAIMSELVVFDDYETTEET